MASKIFEQIFDRNLSQFVAYFAQDSSVIFKDEQNKLIHPGEYGKYKEDACKSLLRLILDKHMNVSDGFVITPNNEITKQCDIIVYNSEISPFIADGIAKMFPAEEVRMIGEIKSDLSKKDFIEALRKMANNKKIILEGRSGCLIQSDSFRDETYDTIASFLICNKLNFDFKKLKYEEIYEDIDREYWHNAILSIEDVIMTYYFQLSTLPEYIKNHLKNGKINTNIVALHQYPYYKCCGNKFLAYQNYVHISEKDKYHHIKSFFVNIAKCCKDVWSYYYDPLEYLGMNIETIYEE